MDVVTRDDDRKVRCFIKSVRKTDVENYRPISILPTLSKVFERIVYDKLSDYLERNHLLATSQFCFRKGIALSLL